MKPLKISHVCILFIMLTIAGCDAISDQGTWTIIHQTNFKKSANTAGFLDESYGITVGPSGENYYTHDKGETWSAATCSSWCLFGLDIVDQQIAWSCGNSANVRLSRDGGKTWQAVTDFGGFEPNHCRFIRFLDAQNGWIANPKEVASTKDGGKTWTPIILPKGIQPITAIDLRTKDAGYLLDISGTLYFTQDQGQTWSSYSLTLNDNEKILFAQTPLSAVRFRNASRGTVILALEDATGRKFTALHSKNSGKTWKRAALPLEFHYSSSVFLAHDGTTLTHYDASNQKPVTVLKYK